VTARYFPVDQNPPSEPPPPDALEASPPPRLRRVLRVFYVVSAGFVLVAVASGLDRAEGRVVPSIVALGVALAFAVVAGRVSASGWAALVPGRAPRRDLRRCVYASQLGKYVPGGVVQAAGQVAIAVQIGIPARDALPAYLVFALHVVLGSLAIGALLATQSAVVGAGWAVLGGLGLLSCALVARPLVAWLVGLVQRVVHRLQRLGPLPPQPAMCRCFAMQLAFALGQGVAFAILLHSVDPDAPLVAAIGAHAFAFGVGLLAVPVPSGLLLREGLMVAVLHDAVPAGTVVTAAIFQRLVTIAAEVLLIAANRSAHRIAAGRIQTS